MGTGVDKNLFDTAIAFVLKHEGGFEDNPYDKGGKTNFGISAREYPGFDIEKLTEAKAIRIYKRDYWKPQAYQFIEYAPLAIKAFDMSVNMGPKAANKYLQLGVCNLGTYIDIDGELGPKSIKAINELDGPQLYKEYITGLGRYYHNLVSKDPEKEVFLTGWIRRLNDEPVWD